MRRSALKLIVIAAVVLGAAVPALTAAAEFVGEQIVAATAGDLLTATADQLATAPTTTDVTGLLIDSSCYLSRGAKATADHTNCAIACAQKGGRLALLTPGGTVYMVIGVLTQDNNAKLISLINKAVVLTGVVGTRVMNTVPTVSTTTDTRRLTTSQTEVVEKVVVRRGDFREGDLLVGSENTIDAVSARLPTPPGK